MDTCIVDGNKIFVTIKPDGKVVFGEGVVPDEAARAFWRAVESLFGETPLAAAYDRAIEDAIEAVWEEIDEYSEGQIGSALEDRMRRLLKNKERKP